MTNLFTRTLTLAALAGSLSLIPAVASADMATEVQTAALHAGMAAKAGSMDMTDAHMHHALNCLVGPKGDGYDSKALDPCKGKGDGAIPDTQDAAAKAELEKVAAQLRSGLNDTKLSEAQGTAAKAQTELSAIK